MAQWRHPKWRRNAATVNKARPDHRDRLATMEMREPMERMAKTRRMDATDKC